MCPIRNISGKPDQVRANVIFTNSLVTNINWKKKEKPFLTCISLIFIDICNILEKNAWIKRCYFNAHCLFNDDLQQTEKLDSFFLVVK